MRILTDPANTAKLSTHHFDFPKHHEIQTQTSVQSQKSKDDQLEKIELQLKKQVNSLENKLLDVGVVIIYQCLTL